MKKSRSSSACVEMQKVVSPERMEARRSSACDEVGEAKEVAVHKGGRPWASS